jgi:hypothetical protein
MALIATSSTSVYCPHCSQPFGDANNGPQPPKPMQCPHCKLVIGAGRGRPTPDRGQPGAAAGLIANEARRAAGKATDLDRARAAAALGYVASKLSIAPDRLSLTLYSEQTSGEGSLPTATEIVQAFGSWRDAQAEVTRLQRAKKAA